MAAAWDFCAPAVDYDIARKEVSAIFDAKITEVQAIVAKLLQTQRAGEQALDKYCWSRCIHKTAGKVCKNIAAGTRGHVPLRLCRRRLQLWVEEGPRACSLHCFLPFHRIEKASMNTASSQRRTALPLRSNFMKLRPWTLMNKLCVSLPSGDFQVRSSCVSRE